VHSSRVQASQPLTQEWVKGILMSEKLKVSAVVIEISFQSPRIQPEKKCRVLRLMLLSSEGLAVSNCQLVSLLGLDFQNSKMQTSHSCYILKSLEKCSEGSF